MAEVTPTIQNRMNIQPNSSVPPEAVRVSNYELASVALKYTSRLSDLRKAGYDIACVDHDKKSGLTHYELQNISWKRVA